MGFVNEFISEEDVEKYRLVEIDKQFVVGGTNSRQWTIDRGRDIYLRRVAVGGNADPEIRNRTKWTLYWHGTLLTMRLDLMDGGGGAGEPGWSHWKLVWMSGSSGLPAHLKVHKAEILADLKEALTAYRSAGVYSREWPAYRVVLELGEECVL